MDTRPNLTTAALLALALLLPAPGHAAGQEALRPVYIAGTATLQVEGFVEDVVIVDTVSESIGRGLHSAHRTVYLDVTRGAGAVVAAFRVRCGALETECFALVPNDRVRAVARFTATERVFFGQVTNLFAAHPVLRPITPPPVGR